MKKTFVICEVASPIVEWQNMPHLKGVRFVSPQALKNRFAFLGATTGRDSWYVYRQKTNGVIIAGPLIHYGLKVELEIHTSASDAFSVKGRHLLHVASVSVSEEESGTGRTRSVYEIIAQHYALVSDNVHYRGAVFLWKSIARSSNVFVYVWDHSTMDWLRDSRGTPVKYNGTNISADTIWERRKNTVTAY